MRERLAERVRQFRSKSRPILSTGSVLVVALLLVASGVAAQTALYEGDFEDGTTEDWVTTENDAGAVQVNNEYMLYTGSNSGSYAYINDTFNSSEQFRFEGQLYATNPDSYIDIEISGQELKRVNWQLQQIDGSSASLSTNTYYNFSLYYADGQMKFFVEDNGWYNESAVSVEGNLQFQGNGWDAYLSEYKADPNSSEDFDDGGEPVSDDEALEIDTRDYIQPNTSVPYSVHFNDSGEWSEVTDSATVTSNNTSVIVVDGAENMLVGQSGVNTTVNVTANYTASDGTVYSTTKQITVAQATVENLQILPTIWRFGATIGDDTMFFLIVAMLTSVVGTRLSTAFGGISLYWVVVMIGWFSGWLSLGILLVTTAMCTFIGLNLALTIDYGMGRGGA